MNRNTIEMTGKTMSIQQTHYKDIIRNVYLQNKTIQKLQNSTSISSKNFLVQFRDKQGKWIHTSKGILRQLSSRFKTMLYISCSN